MRPPSRTDSYRLRRVPLRGYGYSSEEFMEPVGEVNTETLSAPFTSPDASLTFSVYDEVSGAWLPNEAVVRAIKRLGEIISGTDPNKSIAVVGKGHQVLLAMLACLFFGRQCTLFEQVGGINVPTALVLCSDGVRGSSGVSLGSALKQEASCELLPSMSGSLRHGDVWLDLPSLVELARAWSARMHIEEGSVLMMSLPTEDPAWPIVVFSGVAMGAKVVCVGEPFSCPPEVNATHLFLSLESARGEADLVVGRTREASCFTRLWAWMRGVLIYFGSINPKHLSALRSPVSLSLRYLFVDGVVGHDDHILLERAFQRPVASFLVLPRGVGFCLPPDVRFTKEETVGGPIPGMKAQLGPGGAVVVTWRGETFATQITGVFDKEGAFVPSE